MDGVTHFSVGPTRTTFAAEPALAQSLFAKQRALLVRPGIDAALLRMLADWSVRATFVSQVVEGLGHRWVEKPPVTGSAIELALKRPEFKDWLVRVTGCNALSHIEGRVVKSLAGGDDKLDWHKDTHPNIQLGITIHLKDCDYEGGDFDLRESKTRQPLFHHGQAKAGDTVLFDISASLEHRVTALSSGGPRLVFTGWFIGEQVP